MRIQGSSNGRPQALASGSFAARTREVREIPGRLRPYDCRNANGEALQRVAYEQAEDLSRDGIVYFETRFRQSFTPRKD